LIISLQNEEILFCFLVLMRTRILI